MSSSPAGSPASGQPSAPLTTSASQLQALDKFSPLVENRLRQSMLAGKSKRSAADGDENQAPGEPPARTYRWAGRNLARSVGPFVRIHTIVEHGVRKALADSDDEAAEETVEEQRLTESWDLIKKAIPGFAEEMIGLGGNRVLRKQVCAEIQEGVQGARGDDSSALKRAVPDYVEPPPTAISEDATSGVTATQPRKIQTGGTKVDRGFAHPVTARLLLPVKHAPTEETFTLIRTGQLVVLGTELPYFMFRDGYVFNPDDLEDGLLEGHTLFAVAKHIHQGPSAALKPAGYTRGKAGNAALNGVTFLTGRDVAYLACQLRFALSSQQSWSGMDGSFNYQVFFWSIVDLLRGEEGQEIINRFNYAVFGTSVAAKTSATPAVVAASDFDVLAAQRAAKRARKIMAAVAAVIPAVTPAVPTAVPAATVPE
ncbi:hypothetical protein B0H17DRAFT_1151423 [Mycena rosella]|uniref:Uncharacterized protein n=1 Tax=Mycena rosella TaxID=1033263 RepID=A0AAD7FJP1_MYCRO|nr:hypothetical protein B0H17DRAFT_1151423 [Mycena rosella]